MNKNNIIIKIEPLGPPLSATKFIYSEFTYNDEPTIDQSKVIVCEPIMIREGRSEPSNNRRIPRVPQHDLALYPSGNSKEYCKCGKCKTIRERRGKIFKHGILNWLIKLYGNKFKKG